MNIWIWILLWYAVGAVTCWAATYFDKNMKQVTLSDLGTMIILAIGGPALAVAVIVGRISDNKDVVIWRRK